MPELSATCATVQPSTHHPIDQQLASEDAETRPTMRHESLRTVWVLNTPYRARRLSLVNNVLKHHN